MYDARHGDTGQALAMLGSDACPSCPRSTAVLIMAWTRLLYVQVTGADDGLSHQVAQAVYQRCLATGDGYFLATCGRRVPAASMTVGPSQACKLCFASVQAQQ
jgi:hypothetical protein